MDRISFATGNQAMAAQKNNSTSKNSKIRPRPVTVLGLLLLLQAAGLFGLGAFHFIGWSLTQAITLELILIELFDHLIVSLAFIPLALLAIVVAIGLLRAWRTVWVNAMLVQGLSLFVALVLYFNRKPGYVYLMMLYSILIVIYLNYSDVQATLQFNPDLEDEENGG